uniref:Uncharacterized LOC103101858 n=1 Tax=Monodelphis domestica TaxID=13616 RepID=K7E2C9_MONDO
MDNLSRKTASWQSCDCTDETDSPRTSELKLLRARRVAYYESIGILKTSSLGNGNKSALKASLRAPLGCKTSLSESQASISRDRWQSPHPVVSEDVNMGQQILKMAGEKTKEDKTVVGQRVQGESRRNSCPSELDLSLLDDVLVPETRKLRHVMNWAQRFLTKRHEGQELTSPQENPPFTLSLHGQRKTGQDFQETFMNSCHSPSQSRDDDPRIHADSQKSFSFSSVTTETLPETCFPLDLLSSLEERFPGNHSSEGQEAAFQKEKRPPLSPLLGFRQPCFVQPTCDEPENTYSQNQSEPGETGIPSEIVSVQQQPKDHCEKNLFNEDWHGNDYFWVPLTESSEDECTDENGENWRTFRKDFQLRDSEEVSGIFLSPRSPSMIGLRSPWSKSNIISVWETDACEKSKEGTITSWKPRGFISRFQIDSPLDTGDSVLISKLTTAQFDLPVDDLRVRKEESLSQELDFMVASRDLNQRNGLLSECVKADKTFVAQTISGSQEVSACNGFDIGESKIHKMGQRQINEKSQGNDSLIQISNPQLKSLGNSSENATSKICSYCTLECELTSDHHCVMCHSKKVDLSSPTGMDWKITQTSKVIDKEMICESKENTISSSYPVSKDLPETISENSSFSWKIGSGDCRISWDDPLPEKLEKKASVLETYFFYLHQLNKIRGCNSEEESLSFSNHFTDLLENNASKRHPEKKIIDERIRSSSESGVFQAIGHRETTEPVQENSQHGSIEEETTEEWLFPKSLSNLIKESKFHPERPFYAPIKITSKATDCKSYWKKSRVAWSSHVRGEQELRSQTMSKPSSAQVEKKKSMGNSHSICLSGFTPQDLCKNIYIDLEREVKESQRDPALSMWQLLPDEIWICIFSLLSHKELSRVAQVCRHFRQLASDDSFWKRIHISDCHTLNDDCLVTLGNHHPQSLTLHRCHDDIQAITDRGLKQFFHHCRESLQELNVTSCSGPRLKGDKLLLYASTFCNRLTVVDISWTGATDLGVLALAEGVSSLQGLSINGCQITDKAIRTLVKKHGNSLNKLEVFGCHALTARCVSCLALSCPHLRTLNIGRVPKITEVSFAKILGNLRKVTALNVAGLEMVKDQIVHLIVTKCRNLDCLVLSSCSGVTDVSLLEISTYLRKIRNLDVSGCKKVTDIGVQALARSCHQLQYLDLSSTGASKRGVSLLASYCHGTLECVKLSFCKEITLDVVRKLCKKCRRLKMLHLYGCHITPDLSVIKDIYKTVQVFHDVSASAC